jgi:flavin-dependent dehydrogenase
MRVLVIGGGIGGMAASIALLQAGLEPYVLEQAPELTDHLPLDRDDVGAERVGVPVDVVGVTEEVQRRHPIGADDRDLGRPLRLLLRERELLQRAVAQQAQPGVRRGTQVVAVDGIEAARGTGRDGLLAV